MQLDRIECISFSEPVQQFYSVSAIARKITEIMITADQFDLFFSLFKPLNKRFCFVDAFAGKETF